MAGKADGGKFNFMKHLTAQASTGEAGQEKPRRAPLKIVSLSIHDLIPSKGNFYTTNEIDSLKRAIEIFGVKQNLNVKPLDNGKYEIIAGHRRRAACLALVDEGKPEYEYVPCAIETGKDEIKERILLIVTNSTTRTLTAWELMKQAEELKAYCEAWKERDNLPGRVRDMVAELMQVSTTQLARLNAIASNLSPEFLAEMEAGRLDISAAYELAQLPPDKQAEAYKSHTDSGGTTYKDAKALKGETEDPPQTYERPPDSLNTNPQTWAQKHDADMKRMGEEIEADLEKEEAAYNAMYEKVTGADAPEYMPEDEEDEETPAESLDFADMNTKEKGYAAIDFLEGQRFTLFPPGSDTRVFDFIIEKLEEVINEARHDMA